jgi:hypothetical protein
VLAVASTRRIVERQGRDATDAGDTVVCGRGALGCMGELDKVRWDGEDSSLDETRSLLAIRISNDNSGTGSSSCVVALLLSNGLPLRRLMRLSVGLVAGPNAVDNLLSSAVRPSNGDDLNRKNSAAASSEMLTDEMPLAALTMLGMRLEEASGVLDVSVAWSTGGDVTGLSCGTDAVGVAGSHLSRSAVPRLLGKRSG